MKKKVQLSPSMRKLVDSYIDDIMSSFVVTTDLESTLWSSNGEYDYYAQLLDKDNSDRNPTDNELYLRDSLVTMTATLFGLKEIQVKYLFVEWMEKKFNREITRIELFSGN